MKSIKGLSIIIIFALSCCNKPDNQLAFNEVEYATSTPITFSPFMGLPMSMHEINKNLIISDFFGDSLIIIVDLEKGNSKRIAPEGRGPGEFLSPLLLIQTDSSIMVHCKGRFELGYFLVEDLLGSNFSYNRLFDVPNSLMNIFPISKSRILASGFMGESRYGILDNDGKIGSHFGDYPSYGSSEIDYPFDAKAMFHQNIFQKHPKENIIASISSHVIDIIETHPIPKVLDRKLIADYQYQFTSGEIRSATLLGSYPKGIITSGSCSDADYLYLLFNPTTEKVTNQPYEIFVLDWQLNPIKKIILDKEFLVIAIRENGQFWGIANQPEPTIYTIDVINTP